MYRLLRTWFFVVYIAVAAPFLQHLYSQDGEQEGLSGRTGSDLTAFDRVISGLMDRWQLPGGQLAIAKDDRLVLDRSYGYADIERKERVAQTSLFRIGSVSKTITTAAVLTLVDRGHLRLEDKAIRLLGDLAPPRNASVDPRLHEITIQDLLQHAGGWDTAKSFAPLALPWSRMAAATLGAEDPPTCATVLRYMLSIPLDFDPGTRTAYSNFGYCILGLVIEETLRSVGTEMSYEEYMRRAVLAPAGITRMRLGGTRLEDRAQEEVRYYGGPGRKLVPSVFPGEGYVPFAYGGFYKEASVESGGWIGSASDVVRFALSLDGTRGQALLQAGTYRRMLETPLPGADGQKQQHGLCWTVARRDNGSDIWHTGGLRDSNAAWLVRTASGVTLAFMFNSLPSKHTEFFEDAILTLLDTIEDQERWPETDLFASRDR